MNDYKTLMFPAPTPVELDISKVLTSVGTQVSIGETVIKWVHDFADLGGEPEGLDATPLASPTRMNKAGVVEQENWTVDYFYNKEDFDTIDTLKGQTELSDIKVTFNDGTKFTNKGRVTANYVSAQSVNGVADCHAVIELSNADGWKREDPAS